MAAYVSVFIFLLNAKPLRYKSSGGRANNDFQATKLNNEGSSALDSKILTEFNKLFTVIVAISALNKVTSPAKSYQVITAGVRTAQPESYTNRGKKRRLFIA